MPSVAIVDDHEIVRHGLRSLLAADAHFRIVGEARDAREAIAMVRSRRPDVLLLDIAMPGVSGLDAIGDILRACSRTRVLVLSMHSSEPYVLRALRSGASGYLSKDAPSEELLYAMRVVVAGRRYISPTVTAKPVEVFLRDSEPPAFDVLETLTPRERETLLLAAQGKTNNDIAAELAISARTVETHRANGMRKLALHSHTDLVMFAVRRGLILVE